MRGASGARLPSAQSSLAELLTPDDHAFGMHHAEVVVVVYTEQRGDIHVISLRRAAKYETHYYLETAKAYFA